MPRHPVSETRRAIAQDLLRELLEETRREIERERSKGERLRALVRAGKTAGLGATELSEASGLSRPGVYEVLQRSAQGSAEDLDEIVLAAIAAGGATTRTALTSVFRVDEKEVSGAVDRLASQGAISFGTAGYDADSSQEILMLKPEGEELLEDRLHRALSSRPELWTAYIAVTESEAKALWSAAEKRFGRNRTALLSAATMSSMESPELAIAFDVADWVGLFNEAAEAWHSLRAEIPLDPSPVKIAAFSPPRGRSALLEVIGRGVAEANPQIERKVMRVIADAAPQDNEFTICVRALTEAAWALRRSVNQARRPPELSTSEQAFEELEAVVGLRLDAAGEKSQQALIRALKRAADRLGPIPGGRIGGFRGPGEEPRVVDGVAPGPSDLAEIAKASGEALGYAHDATDGKVDAIEAISMIAATSKEG